MLSQNGSGQKKIIKTKLLTEPTSINSLIMISPLNRSLNVQQHCAFLKLLRQSPKKLNCEKSLRSRMFFFPQTSTTLKLMKGANRRWQ